MIELPSCAVAQQGLVTRQQLLADGVSSSRLDRALRSGELVRVARAVYARGPLPALPEHLVRDGLPAAELLLHTRAALLSLGAGSWVCGPSAALLRGWSLITEPRWVTCAVAHARSDAQVPLVRLRRSRRSAGRLASSGQLAPMSVTSALDTAMACLLELPPVEAVAAVDSALRQRAFTVRELAAATAGSPGVAEMDRARAMLPLLDPESGSVLESALRYHLLTTGISGFATQHVVRSRGRYVLRTDFCFEAAGLIVETDGARWHQDAKGDRAKDNALAAAGWRVLRYSWVEVMHELPRVLAEIREALQTIRPVS